MKSLAVFVFTSFMFFSHCLAAQDGESWTSLFNGKNLDGWQANDHPESFSVTNGLLKCHGVKGGAHLFFVGDDNKDDLFKDFVLELQFRAQPESNSGVFFHTGRAKRNSKTPWLAKGYEVQLNTTAKEKRKTGSLYGVKDLLNESGLDETKWQKLKLVCQGKKIQIYLNSKLVNEYTEPRNPKRTKKLKGRVLDSNGGAIALQAHDPNSVYFFRDIRIQKLTAIESSGDEFESMFDGKTLNGWHNPYDWGAASVVDGEIHLVAQKKFFLMSDRDYHDYEFEAEMHLPVGKANSGFMVRGQEKKNRVFGYQCEVDPSERKWSGGLYDEGRRQWLNPLEDQPEVQDALKLTQWNHYRVVCEGDRLQFWVNGQQTTDYYDPVDLSGKIGLQHHGEKDQLYRFRNIRFIDKGRSEWKPIFDGTSMKGWKVSDAGKWEIKDGFLVGTSSKTDKSNGLFYSEKSFGDFTARIKFRVLEGSGGFFFRSETNDTPAETTGTYAKLENSRMIGGLFETGGRDWLAKPLHYFDSFAQDRQKGREKQWNKAHKPAQSPGWATMVVSAHGDRIVTHVNDTLAVDLIDPKIRREGRFAVQLHRGQKAHIEIGSIELLQKAKD